MLHILTVVAVFQLLHKSSGDGVVADWMIAKGFVDLCLEIAEVFGRIRTGELRGYFNIGNAWDLLRSITPIALLAFHSERWLHLLVVLMPGLFIGNPLLVRVAKNTEPSHLAPNALGPKPNTKS